MYYRIYKTTNNITKYLIQDNEKTQWLKSIETTSEKYNINIDEMKTMTPKKVKNYIRKTVHKVFRKELFKNTNEKSKIKYLTEGYIEDYGKLYKPVQQRKHKYYLQSSKQNAKHKRKFQKQIRKLNM